MSKNAPTRSVLLIIGGGIAAYKALLLARIFAERGVRVVSVLTKAGAEFLTPLAVSGLTGERCYTDLFSLTDEVEMGHIELSRAADLIIVAPATADLMAKAANGLAPDLASTLLLATDKEVLYAPAMNVKMWEHPATQRNARQLAADGAHLVGPELGPMACGEFGAGRMAEPAAIADAAEALLPRPIGPLSGKHVVITAGPTQEPIDPVRYLANRSSGKMGYAVASACWQRGADVSLISGPTDLDGPAGCQIVRIGTAREMLAATEAALPADIFIACAAVSDYRPTEQRLQKIKKEQGSLSAVALEENPDILALIAQHKDRRPGLVVGFAAETDNVLEYAAAKRKRKGADLMFANDVSEGSPAMGGDTNSVTALSESGHTQSACMPKTDLGFWIADQIAAELLKSS